MTKHSIVAALASLALLFPVAVVAQVSTCPPDAPTPFTAGPVNPTNGFAEYVTDSNDLSLELCLDGDGTGICFFDPVVAGNLFSQQIGFGPEAFWWLSEATLDTGSLSALVVMAAEAAFATEDPADGDQFPFTRLRIRLDVPEPGVYTVVHPYGVEVYTVEEVGDGDDVNETHDIQFTPGTPETENQGRVGPWLTHLAPPTGYVGDGEAREVTGSPCGTNFFSVSAPSIDLGAGEGVPVSTDLFVVHGKIWDGRRGTPLVSDRTTYDRAASGAGQVDVFATSTAGAGVTVEGGPSFPAGILPLGTTGNTKFFRSDVLADAIPLPSFLALVATDAPTDPTRLLRPLVDVVRITRAEYDVTTGLLRVEATSSDELDPPTLTVVEFASAVGQAIETSAPPARVTVLSSHGGSDTERVSVVSAGGAANRPPVANADAATTAEDTPVDVAVLGNDSDPDGDTLTIQSVASATNGTAQILLGTSVRFTPAPNFHGDATFGYTITDGVATASATVTVTVTPVNDAPVAVNDAVTAPSGGTISVSVLANDVDVDGDALTVAELTQPAENTGTVQLNADQTTVSYAAPAGFVGTAVFQYRAQDGDGAPSNLATVTVAVSAVSAVNVDLDIRRFSTTNRVRLSRGQTVAIELRVRNFSAVDEPRSAEIVGMLNGVTEVYRETVEVRDPPGGGDTTFTRAFDPATEPLLAAGGTIIWTAEVFDFDAGNDVDRATATTQIVP